MTSSESDPDTLLTLFRRALDDNLDPYERYQASEEAFSIVRASGWNDKCEVPEALAYFVFLLVKVEFELVNSYLEYGEKLDELIEACEKFLPGIEENPDIQCRLQENLTKLYITRV